MTTQQLVTCHFSQALFMAKPETIRYVAKLSVTLFRLPYRAGAGVSGRMQA